MSPDNGSGESKGVVLAQRGAVAKNSQKKKQRSERVADYTHDIIRIDDLHLAIDLKGTDLEVIRGASFRIPAGKTVALVGESGSGKSIISQAILGILPNVARITGGSIWYREDAGRPSARSNNIGRQFS